jgi:small subunit ribosomal protein S8
MAQDIVADTLNMVLNANKAGKKIIEVRRYSKFLLSVLAIAKLKNYIKDYKIENSVLKIEIANLHQCGAIKPRFTVNSKEIESFISRYLPAKNIGVLIVSTPKGLMTHQTAIEKKIGGSLIAYFY